MKKFLACLIALSVILCGCSMQKIKNEVRDEISDVKEDASELKEDAKNVLTGKPSEEELIGEDKAKEIALEKAEATAQEVIFDRTELDADDGRWIYEIDFKKNSTEYEADIDAKTGEIVSFSVDKK